MTEIEHDWMTKAGLRAVCTKVGYGDRWSHRNGYVGLPRRHPLFGCGYNEQSDLITREMTKGVALGKKSVLILISCDSGSDGVGVIRRSPDIIFDCHGGLSYSGDGGDLQDFIMPMEPIWWFGFDCLHCDDGMIDPPEYVEHSYRGELVSKSAQYVMEECERLAAQIIDLFPLPEPNY